MAVPRVTFIVEGNSEDLLKFAVRAAALQRIFRLG